MQEPKADGDSELCKKVHALINGEAVNAGGAGGSRELFALYAFYAFGFLVAILQLCYSCNHILKCHACDSGPDGPSCAPRHAHT
jgi:hypothetical protein